MKKGNVKQPFSETEEELKQALGNDRLNLWDLGLKLGWSRGKVQPVANKMIARGELFFKISERNNHTIKIVSARPFPASDPRQEVASPEVARAMSSLKEKADLQGKIIFNFIGMNMLDVAMEIDQQLGAFGSIADFRLSSLPREMLDQIHVGNIVLESTLKKLGFAGIDDERLNALRGE